MFGQKCTLLGSLILSFCVCTLYEMKGQLTLFESYRNTPAELSIYEILTATYLYFFNNIYIFFIKLSNNHKCK